jgi:hypothetical protein
MGYRSEVAFAIHPDKVAEFLAVLSTSAPALDLCRGSDNGIQTDVFMKGDMFIEISGVKWYDSFEEVEIIDKFIADTIDEGDGWDMVRFIRVGEDHDDIQVCGEYAYEFLMVSPASIYVEAVL